MDRIDKISDLPIEGWLVRNKKSEEDTVIVSSSLYNINKISERLRNR